MSTPLRVRDIFYQYTWIIGQSYALPLCNTQKPTIIDVAYYTDLKFPTLILDDHNDSLMLLYVICLIAFATLPLCSLEQAWENVYLLIVVY